MDYLKEKIAYYKLWLMVLTTIDVGMVAWFFKNYGIVSNKKFSFVLFIIFLGITAVFILNSKTRKLLDRLGVKYGN